MPNLVSCKLQSNKSSQPPSLECGTMIMQEKHVSCSKSVTPEKKRHNLQLYLRAGWSNVLICFHAHLVKPLLAHLTVDQRAIFTVMLVPHAW